MTPKSHAESAGFKLTPRKDKEISLGNLRSSCLVRNLVFKGLISSLFSQHHFATPERSSCKFWIALSTFLIEKRGTISTHLRMIQVGK